MNRSKFIVITSINPPTKAVEAFAAWSGWKTIVVGDKKSPTDWNCPNVIFLSVDDQIKRFPSLAALIPLNTYKRKVFGYLYAFQNNATAIFESDDDNIPYPGAQQTIENDLKRESALRPAVSCSNGWANIYNEFGTNGVWPRGFPLELLTNKAAIEISSEIRDTKCPVVQYLADDDPDVDAIYRLVVGAPVRFKSGVERKLAKGTLCPFNSQATLWLPRAFPLMFLPLGTTDRVTDILRGYLAVIAMWAGNSTLAYSSPTVYQIRNEHDLLRDFEQESDLYKNASEWCRVLRERTRYSTDSTGAFRNGLDCLVERGNLPAVNAEAYKLFLAEIHNSINK